MTYERWVKKELSIEDVIRYSTNRWQLFDKGFYAFFAVITIKTVEGCSGEALGYYNR